MKIAIVGTGYVGLVTGTCFAQMGNDVTCIDVDENKINKLLDGIIPIYEPKLTEMVIDNKEKGRLHFTTDLTSVLNDVEIVFSAVGTPPDEDGSADLKYVLAVAKTFGENIKKYTILVTKSTVPVGTAEKVRAEIKKALKKRGEEIPFDVVSNPEFLKEGSAIDDFMKPDRIVVGTDSLRSKELMERLYKPFVLNGNKVIYTTIPSAEMIKYAANSMLATRISFMNDIADLCDLVGANVDDVRKGIGSDSRIGSKFLYPGCGYGGSCFPKDVKALIKTGEKSGHRMRILEAVEDVNQRQKHILFEKLAKYFNGVLAGKTVAVWGTAFKPNTDDMREATSLVLIESLLECGCKIRVCDPIALDECKRRLRDIDTNNNILYCANKYIAADGADVAVLVTEWQEYRMVDWQYLKSIMNGKLIVDGRNVYDRKEVEENGFDYLAIGK